MACVAWRAPRTGRPCASAIRSPLYGVIGALLAMHPLKVHGGKRQYSDVALYEAVFGLMKSLVLEFSASGYVHVRACAGSSLTRISLEYLAPSQLT
ncbi:hypothetical protein GALL_312250 [mine drainage metagenome]|uniref:Uncharacterized protein n=1 Tax=mine drainage metagenome TaxID=410659 RepID=A0A1J5QTI0_9ZZZZ